MGKIRQLVLATAFLFLGGTAICCTVPPQRIMRDHTALANEASTILLVEARASGDPRVQSCELGVLRVLKGSAPDALPIACRLPREGDWMTDFSSHSDQRFWRERGGRLGVNGDCTIIPPAFAIGRRYLALLGVAPDSKQFEEVSGPSDQWLAFIEQLIADGDLAAPNSSATDDPSENSSDDAVREANHASNKLRAWRLSQGLAGYSLLRKSFDIDDADVGAINMFPDSLYVSLHARTADPVNAAWWWDPIDKDGDPQYDWHAFIQLHRAASKVVGRHAWLKQWRVAGPGRSLELHAFGAGIGATPFELQNFVLPVWRDAGMSGRPEYSMLARRGDTEWAQLYFGKDDSRMLVTAVSRPDQSSAHWLDRLDLYFHPKCRPGEASSRYATVAPSGKWKVRTVRQCAA